MASAGADTLLDCAGLGGLGQPAAEVRVHALAAGFGANIDGRLDAQRTQLLHKALELVIRAVLRVWDALG